MKILIGCDVDPVLPPFLTHPPQNDVWPCLNEIDRLVKAAGSQLPPITWLIRSDETVRFATGEWDSGYVYKRSLWQSLLASGHELGWHMHLASFDPRRGCFGFDSNPSWLPEAYGALATHYDVKATRTGWDYGSNVLIRRLNALHIAVDFSALPGHIVWPMIGHDQLVVDWSRCPTTPYHPSDDDYQRPGGLDLLEIPITQFPNPWNGVIKRAVWRLRNGSLVFRGLRNRTKVMTERWQALPGPGRVLAFYFHPEDLQGDGLDNLLHNLAMLRRVPAAEFVTASGATASNANGHCGARDRPSNDLLA
jgi:hypothetical protein